MNNFCQFAVLFVSRTFKSIRFASGYVWKTLFNWLNSMWCFWRLYLLTGNWLISTYDFLVCAMCMCIVYLYNSFNSRSLFLYFYWRSTICSKLFSTWISRSIENFQYEKLTHMKQSQISKRINNFPIVQFSCRLHFVIAFVVYHLAFGLCCYNGWYYRTLNTLTVLNNHIDTIESISQ